MQPNALANGDALVHVARIKKHYPVTSGLILQRTRGVVKAVDGVSFSIREGQTYSLVGESGCGKTTTSRMILMVEPPTEGEVYFEGKDMSQFSGAERRTYRASVQAVFQDPWSSLNPRMRVGSIGCPSEGCPGALIRWRTGLLGHFLQIRLYPIWHLLLEPFLHRR